LLWQRSNIMKSFIISLFALFFALQTQALQSSIATNFVVSKETVLKSEQWVRCDNATIAGHLKNDLFLFANQKVVLTGTVDGAIWGTANQIQLSGTANQNSRLMGTTIQVSGRLNGSLSALADTIQITTNAVVHGELNIVGKKIFLEGLIDGEATIQAAELVTIAGTLKGNVQITSPKIIIKNNTRITGNLTYVAPNELILEKGIVAGKLTRKVAPTLSSKYLLLVLAIGLFSALITGIFLISIFPVTFAMATQLVQAVPWRCLWVGALVVLLLFMLAGMTIGSLIGIPLGIFLFAGWGFFVYASQIVVALVIGSIVLRRENRSLKQVLISLLVGLFMLYFLAYIPGVAPMVFIATTSIGTGALFLTVLRQRHLVVQVSNDPQPPNPKPDFSENQMEKK